MLAMKCFIFQIFADKDDKAGGGNYLRVLRVWSERERERETIWSELSAGTTVVERGGGRKPTGSTEHWTPPPPPGVQVTTQQLGSPQFRPDS